MVSKSNKVRFTYSMGDALGNMLMASYLTKRRREAKIIGDELLKQLDELNLMERKLEDELK